MVELEYIKTERERLQAEYLQKCQDVWNGDKELKDKDKIVCKLRREYSNKDYYLNQIQSRLEESLAEIENYRNKK